MNTKFFCPSKKRFIFLYLLTSGIYSIFWAYKNWRVIKENEKIRFSALTRSLFFLFFSYSFFNRIYKSAKEKGYPNQRNPLLISIAFIAMQLFSFFAFEYSSFNPNTINLNTLSNINFNTDLKQLFVTDIPKFILFFSLGLLFTWLSAIPFLFLQDVMEYYNKVTNKDGKNNDFPFSKAEIFTIIVGVIFTVSLVIQGISGSS